MSHGASSLAAFHLIGDRSGLDPAEAGLRGLRPALFGNYSDLSRVRYDYPVVLIDEPATGVWVKSLTDITDDLLKEIAAPGVDGEEMRRQVLCLEQSMRSMLASGQRGSLSVFWEAARRQMVGNDGKAEAGTAAELLNTTLSRARDALDLDGEVVKCGQDLPAKLVTRAWHQSEGVKAEQLRRRVIRLAQKLSDILKVDYMHSSSAREPGKLESTMGSANQSVFDFQAMARVLRTAPVAEPLPKPRQQRIKAAISVLESQRFVSVPGKNPPTGKRTYRFAFTDCEEAVAEFNKRLPKMADLIKAISIAQLEIENRYEESRHDEFFRRFDENRLGPGDLALFPSYLLCIDELDNSAQHAVLEVLRGGLPFKVLAQSDDILDEGDIAGSRLSFGTRGQQLARMAVGLEHAFVMQASSSSLYRQRHCVLQGLSNDRPALFSVYSGLSSPLPENENSSSGNTEISPYLRAAAATESRVFPFFVYDPAAGPTQASRFMLEGNPQPENDWPAHQLRYENADHNRQAEDTVFTPIDFIAADPRYAGRFACIPRDDWSNELVPAGDFQGMSAREKTDKVPYVLLIDDHDTLHRAVFDDRLMDASERCRDAWNSLQELGGIHNSHAAAAATAQPVAAPTPVTPVGQDVAQVAETAAETAPVVEEAPPPSSDDPWIETIRCTTCNECTELNDRMFAYDEDLRAYVADPDAGTFRELVEAAETCQVAIIHPGKPRNPDEPDLEELLERAEPFNS